MKKIAILLCALTLVLQGCERDPDPTPPAEPAQVVQQTTSEWVAVSSVGETVDAEQEKPKLTDAEQAAQDEAEWVAARSGLAKLTPQEITDLGLEDVEVKVIAHFAAKRLTSEERDALGIDN